MGYHVIDPGEVDPTPDRPCVQRRVSDAADFSNVAVHVYEADPGEQIPLAYHYHDEQEEVFYVLASTLHVETPEREYAVDAGEVFAVEPGNAHRAYNPADADERVNVLAVGAPADVNDGHAYEP
jgi:uncharacterized cupin superfamily protein